MEENREVKREKVRSIPIEQIEDFPEHPFKIQDDEQMQKLIDSIKDYGVITPVVARKIGEERYELISGHRRKYACKMLGIDRLPVIVRDMSRDEAVITMVDSNLQREHILPSEKAYAYKMKMEAMKRRAGRPSKENGAPVVPNLEGRKTRDIIADENGESREQIRRYIRLTELTSELLELVDQGRIAFRPAVELSYLTEDEQRFREQSHRDLFDAGGNEVLYPRFYRWRHHLVGKSQLYSKRHYAFLLRNLGCASVNVRILFG